MTCALGEALHRNELPPLPVATPAASSSPPAAHPPDWQEQVMEQGRWFILLSRELLNTAFAPFVQPQWVACRSGEEDEGMVLADEDVPMDYHLTLSVYPHQRDHWDILVEVVPLPHGRVVLFLGITEFPAQLDHGKALIEVPRQLLIAPDGPPMHIKIELDEFPEELAHVPSP
ncbi:MAG: hypothetical protein HC884_06530 [Chloroflexaceae bacterium]|nr:hypothetical protein [Chloroflexaceae bacterium]